MCTDKTYEIIHIKDDVLTTYEIDAKNYTGFLNKMFVFSDENNLYFLSDDLGKPRKHALGFG